MAEETAVKDVKERVSMEDFVQAVEQSNSVAEVAERTKLKVTSVEARMANYRRKGLPLKRFQRGGGVTLDLDGALAIIAKARGVTLEEIKAESEAEKAKHKPQTV